jgi:hypothetical protein
MVKHQELKLMAYKHKKTISQERKRLPQGEEYEPKLRAILYLRKGNVEGDTPMESPKM